MKDKDYKNEKRNKERKLVEMYEESNKDSGRDSEKAKMYIEILGICLSGISVFLNLDHRKIADCLYFNGKGNLFENSIVKMTDLLALSESTMNRYRSKYCMVADTVFSLLDKSSLID